jgi:hypothetical protein
MVDNVQQTAAIVIERATVARWLRRCDGTVSLDGLLDSLSLHAVPEQFALGGGRSGSIFVLSYLHYLKSVSCMLLQSVLSICESYVNSYELL